MKRTVLRPAIAGDRHYRWRTIDRQTLAEMLARGDQHWRIAQALHVSRNTILRRVQAWGLESCRTGPRSGQDHPEWLGGRELNRLGYILVWCPLHPLAAKPRGTMLEHRMVMEVVLGRYLTRQEVVDHIDSTPYHNWPANLRLFACNADHLRAELSRERWRNSPRRAIPGAHPCSQRLDHCPSEPETLDRAPSEIRHRLRWYVESHRPTNEHQSVPRREVLRTGAWRDPFQPESTA